MPNEPTSAVTPDQFRLKDAEMVRADHWINRINEAIKMFWDSGKQNIQGIVRIDCPWKDDPPSAAVQYYLRKVYRDAGWKVNWDHLDDGTSFLFTPKD
jgi:hypothetical protein